MDADLVFDFQISIFCPDLDRWLFLEPLHDLSLFFRQHTFSSSTAPIASIPFAVFRSVLLITLMASSWVL